MNGSYQEKRSTEIKNQGPATGVTLKQVNFEGDKMKEEKKPLLVTSKELAKMLSVSERTIWRLAKEKQLPRAVRFGAKSVRWKLKDITDWIAMDCPSLKKFEANN